MTATTEAAEYGFQVIRDQGYGRVWTRLATDHEDALATARHWMKEGRSDHFVNGGEYFVQPVHEMRTTDGGCFYEPAGDRQAVSQ